MTTTTMFILIALIVLFGSVFALTHMYLKLRDDFNKQREVLQNLIANTKSAFHQSKSTLKGLQNEPNSD